MTPQRQISVRRAPRYVPFIVAGGVLGIIAAAFVSFAAPAPKDYTQESVFGYFMVLFAAAGVLLGAITALVLDRISLRRAQRATVEEIEDDEPSDEPEPPGRDAAGPAAPGSGETGGEAGDAGRPRREDDGAAS